VGADPAQTPMTDQYPRCRHCKSMVALTPGPETHKPRRAPPHYMHRGYVVEGSKTEYVFQPCLNASTRIAIAKAS
jgi:hypothetical protein